MSNPFELPPAAEDSTAAPGPVEPVLEKPEGQFKDDPTLTDGGAGGVDEEAEPTEEFEAKPGAEPEAGPKAGPEAGPEAGQEESIVRVAAEELSLDTAQNLAEMKAVLRHFDETRLAFLAQAAHEVSVEKARNRGDLDQMVADAFERGFASRDRLGVMPWVDGNLLWAPGSRQDRSAARHVCRFVRVKSGGKDGWVWEHPGVIQDKIRRTQDGVKSTMNSITVVSIDIGAEIDVVTSESNQGAHRAKRIDSFIFDGVDLERVDTRRISADDHR